MDPSSSSRPSSGKIRKAYTTKFQETALIYDPVDRSIARKALEEAKSTLLDLKQRKVYDYLGKTERECPGCTYLEFMSFTGPLFELVSTNLVFVCLMLALSAISRGSILTFIYILLTVFSIAIDLIWIWPEDYFNFQNKEILSLWGLSFLIRFNQLFLRATISATIFPIFIVINFFEGCWLREDHVDQRNMLLEIEKRVVKDKNQ